MKHNKSNRSFRIVTQPQTIKQANAEWAKTKEELASNYGFIPNYFIVRIYYYTDSDFGFLIDHITKCNEPLFVAEAYHKFEKIDLLPVVSVYFHKESDRQHAIKVLQDWDGDLGVIKWFTRES